MTPTSNFPHDTRPLEWKEEDVLLFSFHGYKMEAEHVL